VATQDILRNLLFGTPFLNEVDGEIPLGDDMIRVCVKEDIAPITYYLLKKKRLAQQWPPDITEALARLFEMNLVFNLTLRNELQAVLRDFNRRGLSHLLLKGIALAEYYYPSLSMRRMTDVDLLVHKEELPLVDACLRERGYRPLDSDASSVRDAPEGYLASLEYHRREGLPPLHIHWRLVNTSVPAYMFSPFQSMERLWERSVPVSLDDVTTRMLCPEHLLLHLCEHALRINHSFDRLILAYDIVLVIEKTKDRLDWSAVLAEARDSRLTTFLYCGLAVVDHYAADRVPASVLERLRPPRPSLGLRLFLALQLRGSRLRGSSYLLYLCQNQGIVAKTRFVLRTFLPPAAIARQRLREERPSNLLNLWIRRFWEILHHLILTVLRLFRIKNP